MERSIVAEFQKSAGGRLTLFSMTVVEDHGNYLSRTIYDVNHSRRYGYLFDQTGFGGRGPVPVSGIYFVSGNVEIKEGPCQLVDALDEPPFRSKKTRAIRALNRTRRLRSLPKAFDIAPGQDLLGWMEGDAIQEQAVYCSECRDNVRGDYLCRHCWWCHKTGGYSTPSERCKCTDRKTCDDC